MAKAVETRPQPTPAVEDMQRKLDGAALAHAEAVMDAYRTLQTLHDTHSLEFVRGLLGAGDEVLKQVVSVVTSPQSTRALRNLLILTDVLGTLSPEALHRIAGTATPVLAEPQPAEPPSLFAITRRLFGKDVRRALATGVAVLEAVGRSLDAAADVKPRG